MSDIAKPDIPKETPEDVSDKLFEGIPQNVRSTFITTLQQGRMISGYDKIAEKLQPEHIKNNRKW